MFRIVPCFWKHMMRNIPNCLVVPLFAFTIVGCDLITPQNCRGSVPGVSESLIDVGLEANVWGFVLMADGSTVFAGSINADPAVQSEVPLDAYVVKTDASGEVQWTKTWDWETHDEWTCIEPSGDGGYYLAGIAGSLIVYPGYPLENGNLVLARIDASGQEVWSRLITADPTIHAWTLVGSQDGTFILAGSDGPNAMWARFDSDGNEIWRRSFPQADILGGIMTRDGGYAFSGKVNGYMGVFRTDSEGELEWHFDASTVSEFNIPGARGQDLVQTTDGGYAVVSNFVDDIHGETMFIAKLDSSGALAWGTFVPGAPYANGYGLLETVDGSLVVGGESHSRHPLFQIVRTCYRFHGVRLSQDGELLWSERLGDLAAKAYGIEMNAEGQIVFAGAAYDGGHIVYTLTTDAGSVGD